MSSLHRFSGIVLVVVFLATGAYMRGIFPQAFESDEVIRFQYRANHVYILFAGLLNLALAGSSPSSRSGWRRWSRRAGSGLALAAPWVLVAAFFVEPPRASEDRVMTAIGVFLLALGILACAAAERGRSSE